MHPVDAGILSQQDAALYPEKTSYYYFYTKRNGETVYSKTFEEHQNYVNADKATAN